MTIAVDIREWQPGVRTGIGRFLEEFLRVATVIRPEDRFILLGNTTCEVRVQARNVSVVKIPARWTLWWDQAHLPRQLSRDRVSVYLSPYYKGPLFAPCSVVLTIHDLFFINYPGRKRPVYDIVMAALARLYASRADALIADSEYSKRSIIETLGVNEAKVTVIPVALGAEFKPELLTDTVKSRYGIIPPYILYVGNFKPHKNIERLLHAYTRVTQSLGGMHQLVLGGGDCEHRKMLENLIGSLGLVDRVRFTGLIEDADLPAVYSGCALFVLPSLEEGFGLPVLEAMACGAPVVASNRAAIPEVVGDAALLFDPENVSVMAEAMTMVLSQPDMRERMRRQGLARAGAFTPERTAGRVVTLLREVGLKR